MFSFFNLDGKTNKKEIFQINGNLFVLNNYLIKFPISDIVAAYDDKLKQTFLYIFFVKGNIEQIIIKRITKLKDLFLESSEDNKYKQILKKINNFLIDNINFTDYEEFIKIITKYRKDNKYIKYKICVLDQKIPIEEVENKSMDELINLYCIFRFISEPKKLLFYCPQCPKNEIKKHLLEMSENEKKLIYLSGKNRYVILQKLKEEEELKEEIGEEDLKYLYIKYGLSLYVNNKKMFKQVVEKLLHQILCN